MTLVLLIAIVIAAVLLGIAIAAAAEDRSAGPLIGWLIVMSTVLLLAMLAVEHVDAYRAGRWVSWGGEAGSPSTPRE